MIIALCCSVIIALQAQDKVLGGFFRPVDKDMFKADSRSASVWLFRPVVTITAMQFNFVKPEVTVNSLGSLGTGISYSHFVEANGEPYCNYAFNILALFGTDVADVSPVELSIAGTVTAFQYLNFGAGYNFKERNFFLLTGIQYNFNK